MHEDHVMDIDILLYVEDPGAANYVAHIPSALAEHGWKVRLLAEGLAYTHLLHLGVEADLYTSPFDRGPIILSMEAETGCCRDVGEHGNIRL